MSIKTKLSELFVPGNIKNFLQICKIYYYPPEQDFPLDKVWIYFDGEENKQPRRIRSLCFKNPENHKKFIMNNIGTLDNPNAKWLLTEIEKGNEVILEITPSYCSTRRSAIPVK